MGNPSPTSQLKAKLRRADTDTIGLGGCRFLLSAVPLAATSLRRSESQYPSVRAGGSQFRNEIVCMCLNLRVRRSLEGSGSGLSVSF